MKFHENSEKNNAICRENQDNQQLAKFLYQAGKSTYDKFMKAFVPLDKNRRKLWKSSRYFWNPLIISQWKVDFVMNIH